MKRYVMTRFDREVLPVVVTVVEVDEDGEEVMRPLDGSAGLSLDWTQPNGRSDLARSIVCDVLDLADPPEAAYREVERQLARIHYDGGELTEDEVVDLLDSGLLP